MLTVETKYNRYQYRSKLDTMSTREALLLYLENSFLSDELQTIQSNELVPCNSRVDGEGNGWVIWTQFNSFCFYFHALSSLLYMGWCLDLLS